MRKQFIVLLCIGVLNLILFIGVFELFQNDKIYHNTLGVISKNYERTGGWADYEINRVSKPFLKIENENFLRWDAPIYKCISERMYVKEEACYGKVRAAFFPLFPIIWRVTRCTPIGISLMNYILFIISLALIVNYFIKGKLLKKILTYIVLITLPSTIIYYIPYTESLFLITLVIAVLGIMREKYWMVFIGFFLMSMVRPATIFVLIAILLTETIIYFKNRNFRLFLNKVFVHTLPFLLGYLSSIFIQYWYSGSWTSLIEAHKYWDGKIQSITRISDWSMEGFGMNSFAIFFVAIPAVLFSIFLVIKINNSKWEFIEKIKAYKEEYLFLISILYLAGIFVFTLITSGGSLHSFFRFTLCTPLFYIAVVFLISRIPKIPLKILLTIFTSLGIALFIFFRLVEYGSNQAKFSYVGLFMLLTCFLYFLIKDKLYRPLQILAIVGIVITNIIWNTYMLNMFFSNGWIFT